MAAYDPSKAVTVPVSGSLESLKAQFEENGLGDASAYPSELSVLPQLGNWVAKAFEARAAAITYYSEVKEEQLETVLE